MSTEELTNAQTNEEISQPPPIVVVDEILVDLPTPMKPDGKWRIQNHKMMLTYKYHIDKMDLKNFIEKIIRCTLVKFYCAHECGTNDPITPYEHTHAVIDIGKTFQSVNCKIFDFIHKGKNVHPNISFIIKNARGSVAQNWKRACKYVCKEDKSVELDESDEFEDNDNCVAQILAHKTLSDAFSNMKSLKDAVAVSTVYKSKQLVWDANRPTDCKIDDYEMMFPWQKTIYNHIMEKPDDRSIVWIYDDKGCKGKSQLLRFMDRDHKNKCTWIAPSGRGTDILHVFIEQIAAGWRGDTVLFNLTKSATSNSDMDHVYKVIEDIKDGMIFSVKFNGGSLIMPHPHVVVMSNMPPNIDKLSKDRWIIYELIDKELFRMSFTDIRNLKNADKRGQNDPHN